MYALLGLSVFLGIPILLIYLGLSIGKKGKKKRIEQFRISYEHALNGTDRKDALLKGRIYYSSLRAKNRLTLFDEQTITNDINTMKS